VVSDCGWSSLVIAWLDLDANGARDTGQEPPLAGVTFVLEDVYSGYGRMMASAVTDEEGRASLSVFLPGCPRTKLEVFARPPDGYRATTATRGSAPADGIFAVGFAREP
jgi:hypothetical protein